MSFFRVFASGVCAVVLSVAAQSSGDQLQLLAESRRPITPTFEIEAADVESLGFTFFISRDSVLPLGLIADPGKTADASGVILARGALTVDQSDAVFEFGAEEGDGLNQAIGFLADDTPGILGLFVSAARAAGGETVALGHDFIEPVSGLTSLADAQARSIRLVFTGTTFSDIQLTPEEIPDTWPEGVPYPFPLFDGNGTAVSTAFSVQVFGVVPEPGVAGIFILGVMSVGCRRCNAPRG